MRVADSMIESLARSSVAEARDRALSAQRVASSGLRVERPSDDPVAAAVGRRKAAEHARALGMAKGAQAASLALDSIDDSLSHGSDLLARARELAVQAANDTTTASDRASLAKEVSSLRDALMAVANTQVEGRWVMGGLAQDRAPFDAMGVFVGDRTAPTLEVAPGVRVPTSVAAGEVFAPAGGVDVPAALDRLATALAGNDVVGIRAGIDEVAKAGDQVATARGSLGVAQSTLRMAVELGGRVADRAAEARSGAVEADAYDTLSALTSAQTALQQAVSIAARLPLPGLAQKT